MSCDWVSAPVSQPLTGVISVPSDKSISHRALLMAALANGESSLTNVLQAADVQHTIRVLAQCGVSIHTNPLTLVTTVKGVGLQGFCETSQPLDCGNAGTLMRLLAGCLVGQGAPYTLVGDRSLSQRPMARLLTPLQAMGAHIHADNGHAPLIIEPVSALHGITYTLPIPSAQCQGCLLFAALFADSPTTLSWKGVFRNHTTTLFKKAGVSLALAAQSVTLFPPELLTPLTLTIPGDFSQAAYWVLAATLIPGSLVTLKGLLLEPTRTAFLEVLEMMGANIKQINHETLLVGSATLRGVTVAQEKVSIMLDEFPLFCIAAACARGRSVFRYASELRVKESDRIESMAAGLKACGVYCETMPDGIVIEGGRLLGGEVSSMGDHRVAMAFAIAGAVASDSITVRDCDMVGTSYPSFLTKAKQFGLALEEQA